MYNMLVITICLLTILPHISWAATLGIDVSHYQGTINWAEVASAGVKFAVAKATEGKSYVDPEFITNWKGMRAHNITAGAYHFFHTDYTNDEQLSLIKTHVINVVDFNPSNDLLVVDFETNAGSLSTATAASRIHSFLASLESEFKTSPILYTGPSFWSTTIGSAYSSYKFESYRLWIAHYTTAASPTIPKPWSNYYIWQYSDTGKISGITGNVDLDRMA